MQKYWIALVVLVLTLVSLHGQQVVIKNKDDGAAAGPPPIACTESVVTAALASAAPYSTVTVASGSCPWVSHVQIPPYVTLRGGGDGGTTTITSDGSNQTVKMQTQARLTGFTFVCANLYAASWGNDWRIDHNVFTCSGSVLSWLVTDSNGNPSLWPRGLADHNDITNQTTFIYGYPNTSTGEWNAMAALSTSDLGLGTVEAVYLEDNTIRRTTVFGNAIDCQHAGRYVFRYNQVWDTYAEAHTRRGVSRSCRKWEIYNNQFHRTGVSADLGRTSGIVHLRGGTGVVFNNSQDGGTWESQGIMLGNLRSDPMWTSQEPGAPLGMCDGTSPFDGNTTGQNGWPCADLIGRGKDTTAQQTPYPPYTVQASDPAYFWNNLTCATTPCGTGTAWTQGYMDAGYTSSHIQSGRDFFKDAGARPSYTPYTYPHPGQSSGTVFVATTSSNTPYVIAIVVLLIVIALLLWRESHPPVPTS